MTLPETEETSSETPPSQTFISPDVVLILRAHPSVTVTVPDVVVMVLTFPLMFIIIGLLVPTLLLSTTFPSIYTTPLITEMLLPLNNSLITYITFMLYTTYI